MLSGWAVLQEINVYIAGGETPQGRLHAIIDGSRIPGLSTDAQTAYLTDCLTYPASLAAAYLPADERAGLGARCMTAARDITRVAPVFSYAWFALAERSLEAGRTDDFNEALLLSEATGPNEGWIMSKRVMLASDNYDLLSSPARASHTRDLTMLAGAHFGVRSIAALYVLDPEFRARIAAILETLPMETQRRFVATTRQMLTSRASAP